MNEVVGREENIELVIGMGLDDILWVLGAGDDCIWMAFFDDFTTWGG